MEIKKITDKEFKKYGKIIIGIDCSETIEVMQNKEVPDKVVYIASDEDLENTKDAVAIKNSLFGGMPIQIGYCNGNNYLLNAVEYHRDSEINIAASDFILILGMQQDIEEDFSYDTSKMEAFLVPKGSIVEIYATTLHFAPCNGNNQGFRCVVVLPKGTNTPIVFSKTENPEDRLLAAENKWLIAHEESGFKERGAFIGLKGENLSIKNN